MAGGPQLDDAGRWWSADGRLLGKMRAGSTLRLELDVGADYTALRGNHKLHLTELVAGAEAQLGNYGGAFWVRLDYAVPIAASRALDPQVRLNLQLGAVLTLSHDGWDAFAQLTFVDRGELTRPDTTLPVLNGGFDQQQVVVGVAHRLGQTKRK